MDLLAEILINFLKGILIGIAVLFVLTLVFGPLIGTMFLAGIIGGWSIPLAILSILWAFAGIYAIAKAFVEW